MLKTCVMAFVAGATLSVSARADVEVILVPDAGNDTIASLDPTTGAAIDLQFIDLGPIIGAEGSTTKDIIQVGDELWVSDQIRDRIYRFTATTTPSYIGDIVGGMDNIRGMEYDAANDAVWVSNSGTNNGAPGRALIRVQASTATIVDWFTVADPFDVYVLPGGTLLVSDTVANNIKQYTIDGASLGTWGAASGINFPQQINSLGSSYVVASFLTTTGVYEFGSTGNYIQRYTIAGGPRGVIEFDDGSFLVSSNSNIIHYASGTPTTVATRTGASFQFFSRVMLGDGGGSCPCDFNGDTFVDDTDFVTFAAAYQAFTIPPADPAADLNSDGFVDDTDFVVFAAAYEAFTCP